MNDTISDEAIELVAREMCRQMGFDPDEWVSQERGRETDLERNGDSGITYDAAWNCSRWANYRNDAFKAIATHRALQVLDG
jgi:hypothetical protein